MTADPAPVLINPTGVDADVWVAVAKIRSAVDAHRRRGVPLPVRNMGAAVEALADVLAVARLLVDAVNLDGQSWSMLDDEHELALVWTGTPPEGSVIPLVMSRAGVLADLRDRAHADCDDLDDDLDIAEARARRLAASLAVLAHRHDVPVEDQGGEGW